MIILSCALEETFYAFTLSLDLGATLFCPFYAYLAIWSITFVIRAFDIGFGSFKQVIAPLYL
jgi:hypothetical protein